ncbi:SIMPL domain-containing protein [Rhizobium halophytocola]|uniref:Uncharacterized protein YggE n=1 Tax=Rhizobium halophytocola TaxID=735519 RepID=A0ABS4E3Z0_9HYPH|nr:SIMPL domain-containing protein [Rhizobium halophytocola]MBP1852672.1 uncharacterized protein YggE [Rhizobium halophytocola]
MSRLLAFALLTGLSGLAFAAPSLAQEPAAAARREATVVVSGEGQASLAPDMAIVTLSVMRQADTAAAALADNSGAMKKVIDALKTAGIAAKDLQTSGLSISPLYKQDDQRNGNGAAPTIIGYQVSNQLTVKVRDLSALGGLIDSSVKLGVNEGGSISFLNDDPDPAIEDARKKAVADAMAKARTLTAAAGVSLGRIIEISENSARPMPQPLYRTAMRKEMSDMAVPVESGENSYNVTVNITYAISQE